MTTPSKKAIEAWNEKAVKTEPTTMTTPNNEAIEKVVAELADPMKWNWTQQGSGKARSERHAADNVLRLMAGAGLIEHQGHPLGGHIWIVNGNKYGHCRESRAAQPQEWTKYGRIVIPVNDRTDLIGVAVNEKQAANFIERHNATLKP
jgi:hypothetical protein